MAPDELLAIETFSTRKVFDEEKWSLKFPNPVIYLHQNFLREKNSAIDILFFVKVVVNANNNLIPKDIGKDGWATLTFGSVDKMIKGAILVWYINNFPCSFISLDNSASSFTFGHLLPGIANYFDFCSMQIILVDFC